MRRSPLAQFWPGTGWGLLFTDGGNERDDGHAVPWYRTQAPPPSLITAPDAPLFPDPKEIPRNQPVRPYEEALPAEIHETPRPPAPAVLRPTVAALAWRRHAVPAPDAAGRPMIALIIDDVGMDRKRSRQAIALKGPLTLALLSYAPDLENQAAAIRAAGHELLVHLSMEPADPKVNPGPNVLRTTHDATEVRRRLDRELSRFEAFVGINNHMGSKFTADAAAMRVVMAELRDRGLLFLDSRTSRGTVGPRLARELGVAFAERNIFLDNVNDVTAVRARLAETEQLARRQGFAVAIGHTRRATMQALAQWLPGLADKGFVLVGVSAIAAMRAGP